MKIQVSGVPYKVVPPILPKLDSILATDTDMTAVMNLFQRLQIPAVIKQHGMGWRIHAMNRVFVFNSIGEYRS